MLLRTLLLPLLAVLLPLLLALLLLELLAARLLQLPPPLLRSMLRMPLSPAHLRSADPRLGGAPKVPKGRARRLA